MLSTRDLIQSRRNLLMTRIHGGDSMSDTDFDFSERLMYQRVEEELRQAERRRLAREAGATGQGWLQERRSMVLDRLGSLLVSMGQRLKQASQAQLMPTQEHADGKA